MCDYTRLYKSYYQIKYWNRTCFTLSPNIGKFYCFFFLLLLFSGAIGSCFWLSNFFFLYLTAYLVFSFLQMWVKSLTMYTNKTGEELISMSEVEYYKLWTNLSLEIPETWWIVEYYMLWTNISLKTFRDLMNNRFLFCCLYRVVRNDLGKCLLLD